MNLSKYLWPFIAITVILSITQCDSVTESTGDDDEAFSLQTIPRYVDTTSKQKTIPLNQEYSTDHFTCVVSTLLPADSSNNYRYNSYKITIPGQYKENDSDVVWKDFVYGQAGTRLWRDYPDGAVPNSQYSSTDELARRTV